MNKVNPLNAYKETKIKTASQGRLIVMLYEEAIRLMDVASEELVKPKRKLDTIHNAILKAQEILTELMTSLDFDKGGDIAKNLFNLYMFFHQQLLQSNIQKNAELIKPVRKMMQELRDSWLQIANVRTEDSESGRGVNIAG